VMAGQGTLALEMLDTCELDAIVVPVGGGGLASGVAIGAQGLVPGLAIVGAEPAGAGDAARSLERGERGASGGPDTLCDGLRGLIGVPNFTALRDHAVRVVRVTDEECIAAMRLVWSELKQVVEISSATVLAAVLKEPTRFAGKRVGLVLSGGNVD